MSDRSVVKPINYFERIGNYEKRFQYINERAQYDYWRKCTPGSMPMHERNERLRDYRQLTKKEEEEEHDEYCKARGLMGTAGPIDSSLPRPVRGQDTFGYSWIALSNAAWDYGCQGVVFDLDDLESAIQSGRDLYNEKTRSWMSDPKKFIEDAERWLPYSHSPSRKHRGPLWCTHVVIVKLLQRVHYRMLIWNEMGHCIRRLREKGLASRGMKARMQVQNDTMLQKDWRSLIRLAWDAVFKVQDDLGDAYAGTEGYGRAKARPRFIEGPFVQEPTPCKWDPTGDPIAWIGRDWFAGILCRYCITDQFMKPKTYMEQLIKDIIRLQGQCCVEQTMLDHPERAAKFPCILQDLMAEKNLALDMWWSLHAIYGDRDLQFPPPERRRGGKRDPSIHRLYIEDKVEALNKAVEGARRHSESIKVMCDESLDISERATAAESMLKVFNEHWRMAMEESSGVALTGNVGFEEDMVRDAVDAPEMERAVGRGYQEVFPVSNDPLGQSARAYLSTTASHAEKVKTTKISTTSDLQKDNGQEHVADISVQLEQQKLDDQYEVNGRQMKILRKLFSSDADAKGQVRWDELDKLMKRLGFRVELRGGSVVTWIPPREVGLPINVHRPHPEVSIGPVQSKELAEQLRRKYGWTKNSFVKRSDEGTPV